VAKQLLVPLSIAEFLRVTLQIAKQSDSLSTDQKRRIGMVLAMYETGRDEHLLNAGYTQAQIEACAKSAALALANKFDDASNETIEGGLAIMEPPPDDFCMDDFEKQFGDGNT
jgi:hypothetical protein